MAEVSLKAQLGGVALPTPLMNASGCRCTTREDLYALYRAEGVGAVVTKSMTFGSWRGNDKPRYGETKDGTINANGLCNDGFFGYCAYYRGFGAPRRLFFSMSAMDLVGFERMVQTLSVTPQSQRPRLVEVNVSCPNLPGHDPTGAIDLPHLSKVLQVLHNSFASVEGTRFGLKLPPLFSLSLTKQVCAIIAQYTHLIDFVTCSNSLPRGFLIDPKTDVSFLKPNAGFGGVGGRFMKPIALAEVRRFRHCLPDAVQVVGCGGVQTGRDVYDLLLTGADMVQVGSTLMMEGTTCFARLKKELQQVLLEKGIHNVTQVSRLAF